MASVEPLACGICYNEATRYHSKITDKLGFTTDLVKLNTIGTSCGVECETETGCVKEASHKCVHIFCRTCMNKELEVRNNWVSPNRADVDLVDVPTKKDLQCPVCERLVTSKFTSINPKSKILKIAEIALVALTVLAILAAILLVVILV